MHEHNGASQARAEAIDIGSSAVADVEGRADQDSGCRWRPCLGISDQRHVARRDHLHRKLLEGPSAPELKGFQAAGCRAPKPSGVPRPNARPARALAIQSAEARSYPSVYERGPLLRYRAILQP